MKWLKDHRFELFAFVLGLVFIRVLFLKSLIQDFGILLKYDYVGQHIPFYEEFFRLVKEGMPFWSWNLFLGTNFWSSKAYYMVGDVFAWLAYALNLRNQNVITSLSQILQLKFMVGYGLFYAYLGYFKLKPGYKFVLALTFTFSGWATTFMEHPIFSSFYVWIPLLLIGVEDLLRKKNGWYVTLAVALLVATNFYLFWPICILLLVYWLLRTRIDFIDLPFWKNSFSILAYFILGLGISSIIWLPGLLHILQSQRLSTRLMHYDAWSLKNIASFLMVTLIPRANYILDQIDGVFKDDWYYFHQISLYIGLLPTMLLPHAWYVFETKKERWIYSLVLVGCGFLLVHPSIGLFFHFTYGLRYTLILSVLGLFIVIKMIPHLHRLKALPILCVQGLVLVVYLALKFYFIPAIYGNGLPQDLVELSMLNWALGFSFIYSTLLLFHTLRFKTRAWIQAALILIMSVELFIQTRQVLKSHEIGFFSVHEYYEDKDLQAAIDYLKSYDKGFYRIEQNITSAIVNSTNIGLIKDFMSPNSYDSVFEYPLTKFLSWFRQYPEGNWIFKFTEPTVYPLIDVKYAIMNVENSLDLVGSYYAHPLENARFGKYQIYVYDMPTSLAYTYNEVSDYTEIEALVKGEKVFVHDISNRLVSTLFVKDDQGLDLNRYIQSEFNRTYFDPTFVDTNTIDFSFDLPQSTLVYFSIPNDPGWTITDHGEQLKALDVQGGFVGLALDSGSHELHFKFTPRGFTMGLWISGFSTLVLILGMVHHFRKSKRD